MLKGNIELFSILVRNLALVVTRKSKDKNNKGNVDRMKDCIKEHNLFEVNLKDSE